MGDVPVITYPDLPIAQRRDELVAAIHDHQVVVVAGETGSGKSTQLPKLCLEAGRGVAGVIGHTQPRRLAARTIAERVAEELGTEIGGAVGYTVRFTDRVSDRTRIKVMTDGILLAELQRDRNLRAYDTLIVDEAHERSLNIDFILGYLRRLLPRRPDLKAILTSATIDTGRFSRHFGGAPVVEVSGRTYPVEIRYRPFGQEPGDGRDEIQAICDAVEELQAEGAGDVLVFLSGEREIRDTAEAIERLRLRGTEVLALYARLSIAEQHRVFQAHRGRRIVLATNVAETSLTVPGIRYVVDPGNARISRYNRRTKVQRLPIERVSQASANQRAGRCGRVAPGICIRLYDEDDLAGRPEFTEPEILRTNLASVILQMQAIGLGEGTGAPAGLADNVARFPFVDPPDARAIKDGVALLQELGALDGDELTPVGRTLARLPVDPRLARMVLEADRHGCVAEVLVIASALAIVDPRERPAGKEQQAAELHGRFVDPDAGSDFVTLLNLWRYLQEQQQALGSSAFRRRCKDELLHHLRVREWQDVHAQLRTIARSQGVRSSDVPAEPDAVHRALLAGLLSQVGGWNEQLGEYEGARGARFTIAAQSSLAKKRPKWVMAAELVETNRLRARTVARIRPEWVEQAGAHLVKRSYGEPWWDDRTGSARVYERVTLYGLPLVEGRRVQYARVDPAGARAMVIRHVLVDGDCNRGRIDEVLALEDRLRRRDLLVDDDALFALYDARLPADVVSMRHLDRWRKGHAGDPLELTVGELIDPDAGPFEIAGHPDTWRQGDLELALTYLFDPDSELDGVTVEIPIDLFNRVADRGFDWHVPAWRGELVGALLRTLPKAVRRSFVPVPEYVRAFLERASPDDGPLLETLERELPRIGGDPIPPGSFRLDDVAPHLRMSFRVLDRRGRPMAWSKDLRALKARLGERMREAISDVAATVERDEVTAANLGTVPKVVEVDRGGHTVTGFPALVVEGDRVALRVLPTAVEQGRAMWTGTRRLLLASIPTTTKSVQRVLANDVKLALTTAVLADCIEAAADALLADAGGPAWDQDAFGALRGKLAAALPKTAADAAVVASRVLAAARSVEDRLATLAAPRLAASVADARSQLARLVFPGFVTVSTVERLPDVERYVLALDRRLSRLPSDPGADVRAMARVHQLEDEYAAVAHHDPAGDILWQLEELRVSLYAQALGTKGPVSDKRIRARLEAMAGGNRPLSPRD